jgi:signal transduction histidine kinase
MADRRAEAIQTRIRTSLRHYFEYVTLTPIIVVIAITVFAIGAAFLGQRNLESTQQQAIEKQLAENQLLVTNTLNSYAQVLWGGVGRINSGAIDRVGWQKFVQTYNIPDNFPAISAMAITRSLSDDQIAEYTGQLGQQYGREISVINRSQFPTSNIVAFTYPETANSLDNIGLDSYSQPERQKAMQLATDTRGVAMTNVLKLVRNAKEGQQAQEPAFLLYAPYYQEGMLLDTVTQRRAALLGHVSAAFRTDNVFKAIFSRIDTDHTTVRVYMKGDANDSLVYTQQASGSSGPTVTRSQSIEIYGQTFVIHYEFDTNHLVIGSQTRAPLMTLVFGITMALLIGAGVFFFLRSRHHRLQLDKERDITRAKDELLSLASHQLRTPATGVKQYMGMVLQGFAGNISPQQQELLQKAYKSNERQLHVINDILHLAKLDLGRIVLAKTEFDLGGLVKDVVEEQQQESEAADLKVTFRTIKKTPLYADKHMLRMVIENILSNAIKYTDPGGSISVRLVKANDAYTITVKDTGVGIAQEDLPLLFKQFSRVNNSRSHLVSGTGVGLYLAQHLIGLHDGAITVSSRVGKGSSFIVTIPFGSPVEKV